MDTKTIFVLTPKGEEEASHRAWLLDGDIKRALSMVDGTSSLAKITKNAAPSLRGAMAELLKELLKRGYIKESMQAVMGTKSEAPLKSVSHSIGAPKIAVPEQSGIDELDFTSMFRASTDEELRVAIDALKNKQTNLPDVAKESEAAAENVRREEEQAAQKKLMRELEEQEATKVRAQVEQEAKIKAEAAAKAEVEASVKAELEAENARRAEEQAVQQKLMRELEERKAAKVREQAEHEAKIKADAAAKAEARIKAELEAENVRREEEQAAQQKLMRELEEQEAAKARELIERRAKIEAEAARIKAEQEAARVQAELEALRVQAEVDAKLRTEQEEKNRQVAEAARLQTERDAAESKAEMVRDRRETDRRMIDRRETDRWIAADSEEKGDQNLTLVEASEKINVATKSLRTWMEQQKNNQLNTPKLTPDRQRILALEQELAAVKMERDTLKKAMAVLVGGSAAKGDE